MTDPPEKRLATELRARREKADLSQHELAERLGVNQPVISHWENGRGVRSLLRVLRLAAVLKLRPADFV